jgi:hypothetical protein
MLCRSTDLLEQWIQVFLFSFVLTVCCSRSYLNNSTGAQEVAMKLQAMRNFIAAAIFTTGVDALLLSPTKSPSTHPTSPSTSPTASPTRSPIASIDFGDTNLFLEVSLGDGRCTDSHGNTFGSYGHIPNYNISLTPAQDCKSSCMSALLPIGEYPAELNAYEVIEIVLLGGLATTYLCSCDWYVPNEVPNILGTLLPTAESGDGSGYAVGVKTPVVEADCFASLLGVPIASCSITCYGRETSNQPTTTPTISLSPSNVPSSAPSTSSAPSVSSSPSRSLRPSSSSQPSVSASPTTSLRPSNAPSICNTKNTGVSGKYGFATK